MNEGLEKIQAKLAAMFGSVGWVRWSHKGTPPAYGVGEKTLYAMSGGDHCSMCLNLNGCCFPKNKCPKYPLHYNCHCIVEPIDGITANAECEESKFFGYIFATDNTKKALFEAWGYDIMDSKRLTAEFIRQANEKYANGDFELGRLDGYGQRIDITIVLPRKDKDGFVTFKSGWTVYPDGNIKLTTPYGDK